MLCWLTPSESRKSLLKNNHFKSKEAGVAIAQAFNPSKVWKQREVVICEFKVSLV